MTEQLSLDFDLVREEKVEEMETEPLRWRGVCDLPYFTEPEAFYDRRMENGIHVRELRDFACKLFEKENDALTVEDLKMAFLKMCPLSVNLGGDDHEVTMKKVRGKWILSCNCSAWIFNLSHERTCRHTTYVEGLMKRG